MSEKRRALPSWMAKKQGDSKESKATMKRRIPKKPKSIFYCMNERELVETAVSLLTNAASCHDAALFAGHKVEEKTRSWTSREKPVTRESSECSEAQEAAYVSETDLDVSGMETLPYTESPTHQEPSGLMLEPLQAQAAGRSVGLEAERRKENSPQKMAADEEEEDALQLVREIFFTR